MFKNKRLSRLTGLCLFVVILLAACGPSGNQGGSRTESTADEVQAAESSSQTENTADEVQAEESSSQTESTAGEFGEGQTTESGLQFIEIEEGSGPQAQPGDIVAVHYVGTLEDGTQFDSSRERGEPFQFTLGQGGVIRGWDEGIAMLKEGGMATLIIPPELGYGDIDRPGIPANSTLIFEVELVEIKEPPEVEYIEIEEGSGPQAQEGDIVAVHYTGTLEDGTEFDSSRDRDPFQFMLGRGQVIPGWDQGVALMKEGGKAQLIIPPELAYGAGGNGVIPPNATLTFEVELVEVMPPPEPTEIDGEYSETDSGLQYYTIEAGSGAMPETGQSITFNYYLWLEDGTLIDSSFSRNQPVNIVLGEMPTIPGWDEGLALMHEGETMQFIMPPDLAFGEAGSGPIPPNATIISEVELLQVVAADE